MIGFLRSRGPLSIAGRLVLSAVGFSSVILLVAGIILSTIYRRTTEFAFDERLNVYLKALVADVASFGENERSEPGNLGEPRFELPLSGWYWQISRIDTERDSDQSLRTSKSLFASRLPKLSDLGIRPRANGIADSYVKGPDERLVRIIERVIDLGDDGRYVVAVGGDPQEVLSEIQQFNLALLATFLVLGCALVAVTLIQVKFGLGPLADLRAALGRIRRGDAQRIEGQFPPEISPLAEELNLMVDSNHEIIERARTHVGNLAHALKTPLSVIVNEADSEQSQLADKVREQTQLMRDQVQYYLDRARAAARAAAVGSVTELGPVVDSMVRTFTKVCQRRGIVFASVVADGAKFRGEKQDLEEMLGNLIDNAGKWAHSSVRITVEPGPDLAPERPSLVLYIDDDGPGLPKEKRAEATRRGRRLDETRPGSGLGLSIVVDLAQLYGGSFEFDDSPTGGLRAGCSGFRLWRDDADGEQTHDAALATHYVPAMSFWIAAAALTGLTCLALLMALRRTVAASTDHDRAFYEAQIAEIARQHGLKLIGDSEAEAARTEAARRLLAASRDVRATTVAGGQMRNIAAVVVLVLIPAIALPVYLARGMPDMPSFPLAGRKPEVPAGGQGLNVADAIQQIETHLAKNPDDGRGHEVVAPVYMRLNRHADAVRAYSAVIRLLGPSAERHVSLGEALVFQGGGIVTAEAKAAFENAVALEPRHVKARFFLALAAQQEGDRARAVALLTDLRGDLPEGELKAEISRQLAELGSVPRGGEAIAALPADDQLVAIRSMVEGLAQRLAASGGSAEDWARLIRALTVLKEIDRAKLILAEARQKFAAEPEQLQRIEDAGKGLP